MKGLTPVRDGVVNIRGIGFFADEIRSMMLETGGKVVNDSRLNDELDLALHAYRVKKGDPWALPKQLIVEAIPGILFVPMQVTLHTGPTFTKQFKEGEKSRLCLYFAVNRRY